MDFSTSAARRRASADLAREYARLADRVVERHDRPIALICMEELDEPIARAIHLEMANRDRARVFSSRQFDASRMTALLPELRRACDVPGPRIAVDEVGIAAAATVQTHAKEWRSPRGLRASLRSGDAVSAGWSGDCEQLRVTLARGLLIGRVPASVVDLVDSEVRTAAGAAQLGALLRSRRYWVGAG